MQAERTRGRRRPAWDEPGLRRKDRNVEVRSLEDRGVLVIGVSGRLDSTTSGALENEVRRQLGTGHARIVFDLSALEYISSAGLRVFMMAAREVRGKGSLAMAGPKPHVRQVLDLAGAATFAKMYNTATEAVETLNQPPH
jgi:anti-anti-sigma factor